MTFNRFFNLKTFFLGAVVSCFIANPVMPVTQIAFSTVVATSALFTSFYMGWQALEEYKEASKTPQTTKKEKSEFWLLKSWNKVQRGILGRTSTADILKQNLIEFIYQSNAWWRQHKNALTKAFIAICMGLMGSLYLNKIKRFDGE